MRRAPIDPPVFTHLAALTDSTGLFEHALHRAPRIEHGYCVDDVARALLVLAREPEHDERLADLTETYLRFVLAALDPAGRSRNRRSAEGQWTDEPSEGDWWGRSVWALGTAAVSAPLEFTRARALRGFDSASRRRSPHLRSTLFATLGASEVLTAHPRHAGARQLVEDALEGLPAGRGAVWPWPEDRLRYGNGTVPDALIAAGAALHDESAIVLGLELLEFLLRVETSGGRLSVCGTEGRGPGEDGRLYDQQPIEVAAIADACARAYSVTGDPSWLRGVDTAWAWFLGDNDSGTPMVDPLTGSGFDGLTPTGRNENCGAESTLAALTTQQHARRLGAAARSAA
jgi:hypothetical protein